MTFTDVKEYRGFIKDKARESAKLKSRVTSEYHRLCKKYAKNGAMILVDSPEETQVRSELKERFELTDRRLQNILDNRDRFLNAKQQALTSELVMGHYLAGVQAAKEAIASLDEYENYVNTQMSADEKWIEIEKYTGAKGDGVKALTPRELKRNIARERLELFIKSYEPLKTLAPKIIQIQDDSQKYDSLEDLRRQKEILKKQLKIEEIEGEDEED